MGSLGITVLRAATSAVAAPMATPEWLLLPWPLLPCLLLPWLLLLWIIISCSCSRGCCSCGCCSRGCYTSIGATMCLLLLWRLAWLLLLWLLLFGCSHGFRCRSCSSCSCCSPCCCCSLVCCSCGSFSHGCYSYIIHKTHVKHEHYRCHSFVDKSVFNRFFLLVSFFYSY
jgi:hypothetical protein